MKCSYDKTFTLTKSVVSSSATLSTKKACVQQSVLTSVRSVECGLFA